jgi:hypothetical protein
LGWSAALSSVQRQTVEERLLTLVGDRALRSKLGAGRDISTLSTP